MWVLMRSDLVPTNWYAILQNGTFSTAAEDQLFTSCHYVSRNQKYKLAKHHAYSSVCTPFYAVSLAVISCVLAHAQDVIHKEPEDCCTADILVNELMISTMDSCPFTAYFVYKIIPMIQRVVDHRTVQHYKPVFGLKWWTHMTIKIMMFCVWHISMMWRVGNHRSLQDVRIGCHADELMCMIRCPLSHTFGHSRYQQVNRFMNYVRQWD
jgi:hypothetical protein